MLLQSLAWTYALYIGMSDCTGQVVLYEVKQAVLMACQGPLLSRKSVSDFKYNTYRFSFVCKVILYFKRYKKIV